MHAERYLNFSKTIGALSQGVAAPKQWGFMITINDTETLMYAHVYRQWLKDNDDTMECLFTALVLHSGVFNALTIFYW